MNSVVELCTPMPIGEVQKPPTLRRLFFHKCSIPLNATGITLAGPQIRALRLGSPSEKFSRLPSFRALAQRFPNLEELMVECQHSFHSQSRSHSQIRQVSVSSAPNILISAPVSESPRSFLTAKQSVSGQAMWQARLRRVCVWGRPPCRTEGATWLRQMPNLKEVCILVEFPTVYITTRNMAPDRSPRDKKFIIEEVDITQLPTNKWPRWQI